MMESLLPEDDESGMRAPMVEAEEEEEEDEDWMRAPAVVEEAEEDGAAKRRQQKVITLDELVQRERKEVLDLRARGRKSRKLVEKLKATSYLYSTSDEEGDEKESSIPKMLVELEEKIAVGEEVEPEHGALVFAAPLEFPSLIRVGVPVLQRALQASEDEARGTSLEELAWSGFLRAWALSANHCDESTLRWAYHQMAYSNDDSVEKAACTFLCDLVSRFDRNSGAPFQMEWLPTLVDVKQTLVVYGYKEGSKDDEDMDCSRDSIKRRPSKNLRSVLEFIATCFERRDMHSYYSVGDMEALLVIMVHLTLERGLLEILDKVQDCILGLIRGFSTQEWGEVCSEVAAGISGLTGRPHNGVFILGLLSGLGKRSVDLQQRLALHELAKLAQRRKLLSTPREVAASFGKINLKAKEVDFENLYYQLVIADVFLWCNEGLSDDEVARLTWLRFLALCSTRIFIGNERAFATKLRNRASFFIAKYERDGHSREDSPANFVDENSD